MKPRSGLGRAAGQGSGLGRAAEQRGEKGQALVESIILGLVLLVPIVWMLMVLADVHRAALASTAAAREAGFDASRSTDNAAADRAVDTAIRLALDNHGLRTEDAVVRWSAPEGLTRGARVEVHVAYPVPVVRMPFLGNAGGPAIWVRAVHSARIDPFSSRP
ncbi:MAG: hypothetical protein ACRDJB_00935 [Actinomycetota bacterium]